MHWPRVPAATLALHLVLDVGEEPARLLVGELRLFEELGGVKNQLAQAGALVSGSVTFSDGKSAVWHLDQFGRLALAPKQHGYKPSPADVQAFQRELQNELAKIGF